MRALQLHYTSCLAGQSGSAGFQTRALSSGLQIDEQREIERRGGYQRPRGGPDEPTAEQIATDFPRAFRSYPLESGRKALTLSSYAGRDYSGRWGNFFAHTLVLEADIETSSVGQERWPIDYYEWSGWHDHLPLEQDTEQPPNPLPNVALSTIPAAASFQLEELQAFLGDKADRGHLLAAMGRAVLRGRNDSRPLVIRSEALDSAFWIACILKIFPPRFCWQLSFSTYQFGPREIADINATVQGTDFQFTEAERNYQFYMFDVDGGESSQLSAAQVDYPTLASGWLRDNPERLMEFFSFCRSFRPFSFSGEELLAAAQLFALITNAAEVPSSRLPELLSFAARWATPEGRVLLVERLGSVLREVDSLDPLAGDGAVLQFLAEAADATGQSHHIQLVYEVWWRGLDRCFRSEGEGWEDVDRAWQQMVSILRDYRQVGANFLLEHLALNTWYQQGNRKSATAWAGLLRRVCEALKEVEREPIDQQMEVRNLVKVLVNPGAETNPEAVELALQAALPDGQAVLGITRLILQQASSRRSGRSGSEPEKALGQALAGVSGKIADSLLSDFRKEMEAQKRWTLLYGEWTGLLRQMEDPERLLAEYRHAVLDALPAYAAAMQHQILVDYFGALPKPAQDRHACHWLVSGKLKTLPKALEHRCLELANTQIHMDPASEEALRLARAVEAGASSLQIRLTPDRSVLLSHLREMVLQGRFPARLQWPSLQKQVAMLDANDYAQFLEAWLTAFLREAQNVGEFKRALFGVYHPDNSEIFARVYGQALQHCVTKRRHPCLVMAVKFWARLDMEIDGQSSWPQLEKNLYDETRTMLRKLPEASFRKLCQQIEGMRLTSDIEDRWLRLKATVEGQRKGIFRRLIRFPSLFKNILFK